MDLPEEVASLSTSSEILTFRLLSPEFRLDGPALDLSEGKRGKARLSSWILDMVCTVGWRLATLSNHEPPKNGEMKYGR